MEFANRICPKCKEPNYIVFLGNLSKAYKCMNCNEYFNDIDFEKKSLQPVLKNECMNSKIEIWLKQFGASIVLDMNRKQDVI